MTVWGRPWQCWTRTFGRKDGKSTCKSGRSKKEGWGRGVSRGARGHVPRHSALKKDNFVYNVNTYFLTHQTCLAWGLLVPVGVISRHISTFRKKNSKNFLTKNSSCWYTVFLGKRGKNKKISPKARPMQSFKSHLHGRKCIIIQICNPYIREGAHI